MKVPFFDYKRFGQANKNAINLLDEVLASGYFIGGPFLEAFESSIEQFTGIKYCVGVANATDALEIISAYISLPLGSEIVVPGHTMSATASAFASHGHKIIVAPVSHDTHLIDLASIKSVVTPNTRLLVVTQLNGMCSEMSEITAYCLENDIQLVEDSAQGLGCFYHGVHVGSFGLGGCLSFYPAKNLGCLGDGGAIITNNVKLAEYARLARDHGRSISGEVVLLGRNSRLDSFQSRILLNKLQHYGAILAKRRELAAIYFNRLSKLNGSSFVSFANSSSHCTHTFQNFELRVTNRDHLKTYLADKGIGTLIPWSNVPLSNLPYCTFSEETKISLDILFSQLLMLPINDLMTSSEVEFVSDSIIDFYCS